VLVFTEYRDTLRHVRNTGVPGAAVLHGGLSRAERASAVEAFTRGEARILLATDAAGEGLNLHHRCRIVVNVELPWNPVRLEQRTGRVDRIGQQRRVHTFHLVAHDAGERAVADHLDARRADAESDLGDQAAARIDVSREVERLRIFRRLRAASRRSSHAWGGESNRRLQGDAQATAVCIGGRSGWPAELGGAPTVVFRVELLDPAGRAVASRIVPLCVALGDARIRSRAELRRFVTTLTSLDLATYDARLTDWADANISLANAFWERCRTRELAIVERSDLRRGAYRQQSLFTHRMDPDAETDRGARSSAVAQFRLTTGMRRRRVAVSATPVLLLLP